MIKYCLYSRVEANTYEWKIGDSLQQLNEYGAQCVEIEASGEELEMLLQQFENMPYSSARYDKQRWIGDLAKFIAMNLIDTVHCE